MKFCKANRSMYFPVDGINTLDVFPAWRLTYRQIKLQKQLKNYCLHLKQDCLGMLLRVCSQLSPYFIVVSDFPSPPHNWNWKQNQNFIQQNHCSIRLQSFLVHWVALVYFIVLLYFTSTSSWEGVTLCEHWYKEEIFVLTTLGYKFDEGLFSLSLPCNLAPCQIL